MFFVTIGLGSLQIWWITGFRDQMRKFAYVLLGDEPNENDKKGAMGIMRKPFKFVILLEYMFLFLGTFSLVAWAIKKL